MTVSLDIIVDDSSVDRMLSLLEFRLSPTGMAGFLGATVGPFIRKRIASSFKAEEDALGKKWAPLLPVTQSIRASNPDWPVGPAHPINVRTGELESYVAGSSWVTLPNPAGASLQYPGREPTYSERQKMETAQRGKRNPRTVARPVLGLNPSDLLFVQTHLRFWIEAGVK